MNFFMLWIGFCIPVFIMFVVLNIIKEKQEPIEKILPKIIVGEKDGIYIVSFSHAICTDNTFKALIIKTTPIIHEKIKLIIDFTNIEYFSETSPGLIMLIRRKVKEKDGKMVLVASRDILQAFKTTKISRVIPIYSDCASALQNI